jgi:hypothetical protein
VLLAGKGERYVSKVELFVEQCNRFIAWLKSDWQHALMCNALIIKVLIDSGM